jgi:hypothetical protein
MLEKDSLAGAGTLPLKPKPGLNRPPAGAGTSPLKPKPGLNGPPAGLEWATRHYPALGSA